MPNVVSVIMATYNGSAFVEQTLQSVFDQTLLPDEIVIVDDCSTDDTRERVRAISRRSSLPIKLIALSKNSGGPAEPLNVGVNAAVGDVLILLDQDDRMLPKKIEMQLRAVTLHPECSISIGKFSIIDRSVGDVSPMWPDPQLHDLKDSIDHHSAYSIIDSETAFKPLLAKNYGVSMSNICVARSWAEIIGPFDQTVHTCIDLDFMLRAAAAGPIVVINERLFEYRFDPTSLQRRDTVRSLLEATIVRLRAASKRPEWATDQIEALRYSTIMLASAFTRKGDLWAMRILAETFLRHGGLRTVTRSISKKTKLSVARRRKSLTHF